MPGALYSLDAEGRWILSVNLIIILFSLWEPATLPLEPSHVCMTPACCGKVFSIDKACIEGPGVPREPMECWWNGLRGSTEGIHCVPGSLVLYNVLFHDSRVRFYCHNSFSVLISSYNNHLKSYSAV